MTQDEVLNEFRAAGALLEGHFILSSGLHSSRYLQCARVLMDPQRAARLCAVLAEQVRGLLAGALVIEALFNWPGMGRLAIEAINALDVPLILGCVLYASVLVQLGNLFADLAVARLDPRVRR